MTGMHHGLYMSHAEVMNALTWLQPDARHLLTYQEQCPINGGQMGILPGSLLLQRCIDNCEVSIIGCICAGARTLADTGSKLVTLRHILLAGCNASAAGIRGTGPETTNGCKGRSVQGVLYNTRMAATVRHRAVCLTCDPAVRASKLQLHT